MFLYNPLEQFEPIPFITFFINDINFSITSISIMFIYILLITSFFFNGFLFQPKDSDSLTIVKDKESVFTLKTQGDYFLPVDLSLAIASFTKEVSYFGFLVQRSSVYYHLLNKKATWVSSSIYFSSLRNRYSVIFYKGFYSLLSTKLFDFTNSFLFNKVKGITSDFLSHFTLTASYLNNAFDQVKETQSLHTSTNSITKSIYQQAFIPRANLFLFESIYVLILNELVKPVIGSDKRAISFFPIIFTLFLFLLIANFSGLVPYGSTVTAYLAITFIFSTMVMVGVTIYAFKNHGIRFFGHFLPGGCPAWLWALIIPIEILSYVFRVVSLAVRLFANMMAGHTLFGVIAGFGWAMATGSVMIAIVSPLPILVILILVGLETFVALIQAYVFTILTCFYIEETINIH